MTFIKTWNEALPAGTRDVNLGAGDITDFKYAIRERLAIDHDFRADETGITTIGYHKAIHMVDQVADPSGNGVFYRKGDDIYYTDGSGNTVRITSGGAVNAAFPAGIIAMWGGSIATIPAGWALCDGTGGTPNLLAKFIRGIATALTEPGDTGGSDTHTHTIAHTHTYSGTTASHGSATANPSNGGGTAFLYGAHTHAYSGTTDAASAADSGSGSTLPAYYALAFIRST